MQYPVLHFRRHDFENDGTLCSDYFLDKIVLIMIYADYCKYCKDAKIEFQNASNIFKHKKLIYGAIQLDGTVKGERECEILTDVFKNNYIGVPEYVLFVNNKPLQNENINDRDTNSIINFVKNKL